MIEPAHEKEARSDHHNRQTLRKPADRSKKFNQKNATKPIGKSPNNTPTSASSTGSFNRTHGKRVDFIKNPGHVRGGSDGSNEFGLRGEDDDDTETEERERAIMVMQGAEATGSIVRGVDGIVLEETREAASTIPIEELLASAYAKKPKKSKADRFDYIRGLGKQQVSLAPRSIASSYKPPRKFPHEKDEDSDWESFGEDGTEAWDYSSEWKAEMGDIMGETLAQKTSYRDALAMAAVMSLDSTVGSETSEKTDKTDELP